MKEVAKETSVSRETLAQWKRQPSFEACLNRLRQELLETGLEAIRASVIDATRELAKLAKSADSDETKRKACLDILEMAGLKNPKAGIYGRGIGATTEEGVIKEQKDQAETQKLIDSLGSFGG